MSKHVKTYFCVDHLNYSNSCRHKFLNMNFFRFVLHNPIKTDIKIWIVCMLYELSLSHSEYFKADLFFTYGISFVINRLIHTISLMVCVWKLFQCYRIAKIIFLERELNTRDRQISRSLYVQTNKKPGFGQEVFQLNFQNTIEVVFSLFLPSMLTHCHQI